MTPHRSGGLSATVLVFFKVDCPTCRFTLPFLERLHARLSRAGLFLLGVSQDDAAATAAFADRLGIGFPIALDPPPYAASRARSVEFVPTIVAAGGDAERTIVGFDKAALETLAFDLAARLGAERTDLFTAAEASLPPFRPG